MTVTIDGANDSRYGSRHVNGRTKASWRICILSWRHDATVPIWLQSVLHAWPGERGHVAEVRPVGVTSLRQCSQVGARAAAIATPSRLAMRARSCAQATFWLYK